MNNQVSADNYDPNIVPAETSARKEREQEDYKQVKQDSPGDIKTDGGQTVDKEGLANNYPIEPEMYVEEPGDLREEAAEEKAERAEELRAVNQTDEEGNLSPGSDTRSKGAGLI